MANEFVARKGIISLGGLTFPYQQTSVNYTGGTDDFFIDATQSGITITLPDSTNLEGKQFVVKNSSPGNISITGYSGQSISGLTNENLGTNNTVQFVSNNGLWVVSTVGGPVRTSTNNGIITSDGTLGGVDANSGLTFDGQTLRNLVPQTSATTYIESYAYKLNPFTATTAHTTVFTYPLLDTVLVECDFSLVKDSGTFAFRGGTALRFSGETGEKTHTSTNTTGTSVISFRSSSDTTNMYFMVRTNSSSEVCQANLNIRAVKK